MTPQTYLPSELAARWRCTTEHILDMIHENRLPAFSLSKKNSKRPRYRITAEAVAAYEAGEKAVAPVPAKRKSKGQVIEFFKDGTWQPNAINEAKSKAKK